jgi:hypothetical protein
MESVHYSNTSDGESEWSPNPDANPLVGDISITPVDACIMKGYLAKFQPANSKTWSKIVETVMGVLYALRPPGSVFNKKTAKRVSLPMLLIWFAERK